MKTGLLALMLFLLVPIASGAILLVSPTNSSTVYANPQLEWLSVHDTYKVNITGAENLLFSTNDTQYAPALASYGVYTWQIKGTSTAEAWNNITNTTINETVTEASVMWSFTKALVSFNLSLEAPDLEVNNTLQITLSGPSGTTVSLRIAGPQLTDQYSTSIGETDTILIYIPTEEGEYNVSVDFFFGQQNISLSESFRATLPERSDPMSVSILASDTNPEQGQQVTFNSQVINAAGDESFMWDLNADSSFEGSGPSFSFAFPTVGPAKMRLQASGSNGIAETTLQLTVTKPVHDYELLVRNSQTNAALSEAIVWIFSEKRKTNSQGKVAFSLSEGDYRVNVSKEGYESKSFVINLDADDLDYLNLTPVKEKDNSPVVTLISTPSSVTGRSATVSYRVKSSSKISDCQLFYNLDEFTGWRTAPVQEGVARDSDTSVTMTGLQTGRYRYKVRCTDVDREIGFSNTMYFDVKFEEVQAKKASQTAPTSAPLDALMAEYDDLIIEIAKLSGTRKTVADAIGLDATIKRARVEAQNMKKKYDFQSALPLTEYDAEGELARIQKSVSDKILSMPSSVKDIGENEFVTITNKEGVNTASQTFIELHSLELSKSQASDYVKANQDLQKNLEIYTRMTVVQVSYSDGKVETYTLITRDLDTAANLEGTVVLEQIPKSVMASSRDIISLSPYAVLEDDPILEFSTGSSGSLAYIVRGELTQQDVEQIASTLIYKDLDLRSSKLTGFAFAIPDSTGGLILSELLMIVLFGAMAFFVYSKYMRPDTVNPAKLQAKLVSLLSETYDRIKLGDTRALRNYDEILYLYKNAGTEQQTIFAPYMKQLEHFLMSRVAEAKIRESHGHLDRGDLHRAKISHGEAHGIIGSVPRKHVQHLDMPLKHLNLEMDVRIKSGGKL